MMGGIALALLLPWLIGPARPVGQRPDLSGTYTLVKARSTLVPQAAALDSGVVRIEHREPAYRFHRVFFRGVAGDTLDYAGTTDGRESVIGEGEVRSTATLGWSGDTLVFAVRMEAPWGAATNVVRYALRDGGRTLEARETFRGARVSYDNVWVFERRE